MRASLVTVQIAVIHTEPEGPHLFKIVRRVAVTNVHGQYN
jgi:hypothetical protein